MPIRINLLAETQAAEEMRRRDPVKRAIWTGGAFVFLVLLWSGWLQLKVLNERAELQKHEGIWKSKEKSYQAVTDKQKKLGETERKLAALNRLSTNRFLWAPVLNAFQQTVVDQVAVTRIKADQSYSVTEGTPAKTVDGKSVPAKPSISTEKISIVLDAKDLNPAEQNYNKFKSALANFALFRSPLQKPDSLRLTGLSQPTVEPNEPGHTSVQFTLELQYPEVRRNE